MGGHERTSQTVTHWEGGILSSRKQIPVLWRTEIVSLCVISRHYSSLIQIYPDASEIHQKSNSSQLLPCPPQADDPNSLVLCSRLLGDHLKKPEWRGGIVSCKEVCVFFFFWFGFKSRLGCHGYRVMAALNGREVSSSGGGVHAPLHKRNGLNFLMMGQQLLWRWWEIGFI